MSVRGALRKERAYREQHAVNQKRRLIRICPTGRFRSRSAKGKSRISPISGPAGCPPARPDCANCRNPANLTNHHRVRTWQSSSLSDGSCRGFRMTVPSRAYPRAPGPVVRKPSGKEPAGCGPQRCRRLYGDFDTAVEDAAADDVAGGVSAEPRGGSDGARVAGQQGSEADPRLAGCWLGRALSRPALGIAFQDRKLRTLHHTQTDNLQSSSQSVTRRNPFSELTKSQQR